MTTSVVIAIISTFGGIISTWLTIVYTQRRRAQRQPKGVEFALEGYEKLLRDQQKEISRKSNIIDRLDAEVAQLQGLIETLRTELSETKDQNVQLRKDLASFRTEYNASKG